MSDESPEFEVEIHDVAYGGDGVARHEGKVVFVPGALTGERVRAALVVAKKSFARARLGEVVAPAPARIAPACPLALRPAADPAAPALPCPGCAYQHVDYSRELPLKQDQLRDLLARIGGCDPAILREPVGAPTPLGYRNKIVLHVQDAPDGRRLGYFGTDNRTVLDVPACPLAHPSINALLERLRADPGFLHDLRDGATVTLRFTDFDGAVHWVDKPAYHAPWLTENTPVGKLRVPRGSFFQVHPAMLPPLVAAVNEALLAGPGGAPEAAVDAYCGAGLFALAAARAGAGRVLGIESDRGAVAAARHNARHHHAADRVRFEAGDVARGLAPAIARLRPDPSGLRPDPSGLRAARVAVILDPPRTGLDARAVAALLQARPASVVYVSCAPDTLARDLKRLAAGGYEPQSAQLFDLFPRTAHFETIVTLHARNEECCRMREAGSRVS